MTILIQIFFTWTELETWSVKINTNISITMAKMDIVNNNLIEL